ncbi:MAG TPA: alkaline phosphatase [Spirochaetota bacterium]|nr:alkaline phosphatase [Spirochaetota bacterium]HPC40328.1 alkaline phosphatase [Spirochaetota bacterium]HPL16125.1 alkaline phosphatase [Spirochaetota bacterium]HQJ69274.1 alkaline phosphatase [Spirochaetota bacterium]HRS76157.1 alkaline phosphatase [Spirochaetota bacterium]
MIGCYDSGGTKHVILFIGDGMHLEHEIAASRCLTGRDDGLVFHRFPCRGYCTTWDVSPYNHYASLNGAGTYDPENYDPVLGYNPELGGDRPYPLANLDTQFQYFITHGSTTGSASAATAVSTGYQTDGGNVNWKSGDPADGALRAITEDLRHGLGFSFGIVSTVEFSHATPACFASNNVSRNNYGQIGREIASVVKPDVVVGAGHPNWEPGKFKFLPETDYSTLKTSGEYVFVERTAGSDGGKALARAAKEARKKGKKLFGLFCGSGGMLEPPVPADNPGKPQFTMNEENPQLSEMVKSTLQALGGNPNGFSVMFEQGDIDWANHANDYRWMIGTVYDLNEAVRAAIEFVNKDGDGIEPLEHQGHFLEEFDRRHLAAVIVVEGMGPDRGDVILRRIILEAVDVASQFFQHRLLARREPVGEDVCADAVVRHLAGEFRAGEDVHPPFAQLIT